MARDDDVNDFIGRPVNRLYQPLFGEAFQTGRAGRMTLKLKMNLAPPEEGPDEPEPADQPTEKPAGGALKIKFKNKAGAAATGEAATKPKRQYNRKPKAEKTEDAASAEAPKKTAGRKRKSKADESEGEDATPAPKKAKAGGIKLNLGAVASAAKTDTAEPQAPTTQFPKIKIPPTQPAQTIKFKNQAKAPARTLSNPLLKLHTRGRPPPRPVGQGYDSEGEDIEADPAIESQFILSFDGIEDVHGDVEYVRKMIDERKVGYKLHEGGADIDIRFFPANDPRRAVVHVRGRRYAAILVDLPCVVESMKSWDKKNFYKVADVSQKLLVLGLVKTDDEARTYPVPPEVDSKHWLYPHGLTPPMHWVRKRRTRHQTNVHRIEEIEAAVKALMDKDEQRRREGWTVTYEFIDPGQEDEGAGEEYADADENETYLYGVGQDGEEEIEDEDTLAQMLQEGFEIDEAEATAALLDSGITPDTALHTAITSESGVTPASQDESHDTADEGIETGDEDDGEVDEEDEEERARQEARAELMEEIGDLKKEIKAFEEQAGKQTNPMLKKRAVDKAKSLTAELELKLAGLGVDGDD